jgi:Type II secretion system (T2SS), protein E, N-terminal domain
MLVHRKLSRPGMSRFSQFLLQKKLLVPEQLEQALQHQAVYGARLGTNLVELRILTVERLAECLSEFHQVPLPPRAWIERPKRNAVERVTRPLVERIRFIPMRLEDNNILHAAVLDPNDPRTLDDLRFATGCKIRPYVLPEIWMHDWLFTLFKLPRGIRHIEANDADQELEKPAQAYDFQAAQAAQAAIAAKANRIMVPATVGVVTSPEARPDSERKTLTGVDRAAVMAEARNAAGAAPRSGPPAEGPPRVPGERTSFQGISPVARSVTAQGQPARPAVPERQPAAPVRVTAQGAPQQPAAPVRVTAQGAPQQPAAPARVPFVVDKDAELFPLAAPAPAPGASVRPPPISIKSLSEVTARTSLPSVTGISSGGFAPPVVPIAPPTWEPEATTSPALRSLREALRPEPEPPPKREPEAKSAPQTAQAAAAPKPVRPPELSDLENSLRLVTDREQLIEISFSIASRFARVVALFLVHRGMVQGVRCMENGEVREINGVLMPLESASMLTHAANQFVPFRIDPREKPVDARVQQLLTTYTVNEAALFPIVVKQRTVNLLYASHGSEPLGAIAFGALTVLAEQMGAAYGALILNRKGSSS